MTELLPQQIKDQLHLHNILEQSGMQILTQLRDQIAALPLGMRPKKTFKKTVDDFLKHSSDFEGDSKYVDSVYLAIIDLQNHILVGKDAKAPRTELESLLYDPRRFPDRQHFLGGMQTSKIFTDRVCDTVMKMRNDLMGEAPGR